MAGALSPIKDKNNSLIGGGPILAAPQTVFHLPNHTHRPNVELHDDTLIQAYLRQPFPNPEIPKARPGWFDRMAAALSSAGGWAAGVIAGDFKEDPTLSQIITNTTITMIPLVDQAADLRDIAAGLHHLLWVENGYQDYLAWAGLGLTVIGLFPTVGSLAKGVLKAVFFKLPLDRLFKAFNSLAKGHAGRYLKKLQNGELKELCSQAVKKTRQILNALYENLYRLKDRVPDFLVHIKDKISAVLRALDQCANRLNAMFSRFFDELAEKLNRALGHKADLAFEGVPNSTVTYKQVKQEPPVFMVENGAKKEYIEGIDGIGPKKTAKTANTEVEVKKQEDILVLGRGPKTRIEELASKEGGHTSKVHDSVPKDIFKNNYSDIRKADKIVQYMDDVPTTLDEALEIDGGQYSRAETYMINQRKDLLEKTIRKFER